MKYAITAATGKFGQTAVNQLLQLVGPDDEVIAIVRDRDRASQKLPKSVTLREGTYDDETSMERALSDVDRVLFISSQPGGELPRSEQHQNMVTALSKADVKFVAYTSFPHAQASTDPLASDHKLTEDLIQASGVAHAFLRNNWYLENEMDFLQKGAHGQTATYWANPSNSAGWALEREYAEAAAKVLTMTDPQTIYEFGGPKKTYSDLGEALKQATQKNFEVGQVSRTTFYNELIATGMDEFIANMVTLVQQPIDDGALSEETVDLPDVLGHNLVSLPEAIQEILK
ncbi:NAD(P)H-binding protein [Levilactobacillus bambusae]|uniref:NAD(P)-dependent oxidoreductase n=1 Tax=Levilactobacillus bambusae TaxID=2024736 RepID=A0A2V1MZL8_9LACO|nr:NAD(P)H-binding protein [Levilactobacillus bambusae]PWG00461.1 NAD(P)-dependent oxidoreductase [Levilactobacillus bambusae]